MRERRNGGLKKGKKKRQTRTYDGELFLRGLYMWAGYHAELVLRQPGRVNKSDCLISFLIFESMNEIKQSLLFTLPGGLDTSFA